MESSFQVPTAPHLVPTADYKSTLPSHWELPKGLGLIHVLVPSGLSESGPESTLSKVC